MQSSGSNSGSLQSLDWNGGMEWWNGIVECVLQGERPLLMQFSMKVSCKGQAGEETGATQALF